ncbi:MAG: hypothetical protein ACWA5P_02115 [bacterium]
MGQSKETFMQVVQLEELQYDHTFSKKEAKLKGEEIAKALIDSANKDPFEVLSNIVRLKEVINSVEANFKKADVFDVIDKEVVKNGVKFSLRNSGDRLDYEKDEVYKELKERLKSREDLLKLAWKSKDEIYDNEGVLVPKVGIKTVGKMSLVISY